MRFLPAIALLLLTATTMPSASAIEPLKIHLTAVRGVSKIVQSGNKTWVSSRLGTWHQLTLAGNLMDLVRGRPPTAVTVYDHTKLPDTEIAFGTKNIQSAWFTRPTERYDHGVLGDSIEAGALKAKLSDGKTVELVLPEDAVFEDRIPRLIDADGDGRSEIMAVKSYLDKGAALTLIGVIDGNLKVLAEAPAIGLSHRWLNPIGAADFDGDGKTELAVVITPHIGGTLQLYEWHSQSLYPDNSAYGFSNHSMGSRELGLSAIIDVNNDGISDIVLPDASRSALIAITFAGRASKLMSHTNLSGRLSSGLHVTDLDQDGKPEILFATENQTLTLLRWPQ